MAEENPFRAPEGESPVAVPRGSERNYLIRIATAQRRVLFVILAYICLFPLNWILRFVQGGHNIFYGVCVIVMLAGALMTYRLAALFRGKWLAIIYTVGLVVPFLGLLLLLSISQEATSVLKARGVKVGLLGANPDSI